MRYVFLALIFSLAIIGLFYALEPGKGRITHRQLLTTPEKNALQKLPKP